MLKHVVSRVYADRPATAQDGTACSCEHANERLLHKHLVSHVFFLHVFSREEGWNQDVERLETAYEVLIPGG